MIDVLSFLFEILSIVFCLHYLYGEKVHWDKKTIGLIVIDLLLLVFVKQYISDNRWSTLMYPIIMCYCGLKFGFQAKTILINNILYMVILSGIQATMTIIVGIVAAVINEKHYLMLLTNILSFGTVSLILRKCKLKKLSDILQNKEHLIISSLIVAIGCIIIFLSNYKGSSGFDYLYYLVLLICIMLVSWTAWDIGNHKGKVREAEAELRLHKLYEASFRNLIEDICARQHEFDNHMNAIYNQRLLYDTYEELVTAQGEYCEAVIQENKYNKLLSKGNPVILGFLYGKFVDAEKQGIHITYKVSIENAESVVPIYKMIELLGNLIKNAVEALLRSGLTKLHVLMIEEAELIRIEIGNEVDEFDYAEISQLFKKGYSTKGAGRGYGLYNVKKICEEYQIEMECSNPKDETENWLYFKLLMKKSL